MKRNKPLFKQRKPGAHAKKRCNGMRIWKSERFCTQCWEGYKGKHCPGCTV